MIAILLAGAVTVSGANLSIEVPRDIIFGDGDKTLVTICTTNGAVTLGEGVSTNEAAMGFWNAVREYYGVPPGATESVQTVTNVVEADNSTGCRTCEQLRQNPGILIYHECDVFKPYRAATERTVTTTVKRVTTLRFTWMGKERAVTHEEILSEDVKKYVKKEEWVED